MPKIPQHDAHHIVFGAGLIGCFIGACLVKAKQIVSLYARDKIANELKDNEYKISDYLGHEYAVDKKPAVFNHGSKHMLTCKADVVWITVKCTQLEFIIDELQELIDETTIIICCQNGVSTHKVIKAAYPKNHVIRAMVPFNIMRTNPGQFHRASEGRLTLEATPAMENTVKWLTRQLDSPILPMDITHNMTELQWAKLMLNLANAMNALVDMPLQQMLEKRKYRRVIALMMMELLRVTTKKKIKLPKIAKVPNKLIPFVLLLPGFIFRLVAPKMLAIDPQAKTSMCWDLHEGRKTEIDFINGKVVQVATDMELSVPANRLVTALIKKREQGKKDSIIEIEKRFDALLSGNR